jgi:predicted RND superfamily exporter protein
MGLGLPAVAMRAPTIGLGVDYSVHVVHRFADESHQADLVTALDRTVRGTGGALFGSMLTTVFGIGVLALAVFPAIGQFGILTALSIVYAFLTSLLVLPSVLVIWYRVSNVWPGGFRSLRRNMTPAPGDDD